MPFAMVSVKPVLHSVGIPAGKCGGVEPLRKAKSTCKTKENSLRLGQMPRG